MKWDDMTSQQQFETIRNMQQYGGGFASKLAEAWLRADSWNCARLAAAFPDLIDKYQPSNWQSN